MKPIKHLVASFLLALAVSGLNAQAPELKPLSYSSDGFRASFPSEPSISLRNEGSANGSMRKYSCSVSGCDYAVGVVNLGQRIAGKDPNAYLQSVKNGALSNSAAHLVSEGAIKINDFPGLAMEAENASVHFSARLYLVERTLYQIVVVYPLKNHPIDLSGFLDSFMLIPRAVN